MQAAFTTAELREILKLENCKTFWREQDFEYIRTIAPTLDRSVKRRTELMLKSLEESKRDSVYSKELHPIFLRSPVEFHGNKKLESIRFAINCLRGEKISTQVAEMTDEFEVIPCSLGLRSIGYQPVQIDNTIPFDFEKMYVKNVNGKVEGNLYAAGWAATGPTGVLPTTMMNAFQVARLMQKELITSEARYHENIVSKTVKDLNIKVTSYRDWQEIDRIEKERGTVRGKVREKIVDENEMLEIARVNDV